MRRLFKFDHYSILTNYVYALIFTTDCGLTNWRVPTVQGAAFNQVNMVVEIPLWAEILLG